MEHRAGWDRWQEVHLHRGGDLAPQLQQLLVALFDLLGQTLVLNLQLLKVDEMQALCELLLLPDGLLQPLEPAQPPVCGTPVCGPNNVAAMQMLNGRSVWTARCHAYAAGGLGC